MPKTFSLTLKGGSLFPYFIGYLVAYLLMMGASLLTNTLSSPAADSADLAQLVKTLGALGATLAAYLVFFVIFVVLTPPLCRLVARHTVVDGTPLEFKGTVGAFFKVNLVGALLCVITLGIYIPWFYRNLARYFVDNTSWKEQPFQFHGKGGTLLLYGLLSYILPLGAFMGIMIMAGGQDAMSGGPAVVGFTVLFLFIFAPFLYLLYKWLVDLSYGENRISWDTRFWPAVGYVFGQIILCAITLGIYIPAASLRCLRYFAARTVVTRQGQTVGRFDFHGPLGAGFLLCWGQGLLSLITLGIYWPWAICRIGRWTAENLEYRPL